MKASLVTADGVMAHLIASLKDYFELEEINIDSWTFKLYYKASCAICMLGATVGVASQYFGDPIRSVLFCSLGERWGKNWLSNLRRF